MALGRPSLPTVLTLLIGGGLSVLATFTVARWERASYRLQFQRQTDSLTTSLQRSINRYTDLLLALGDFYAVSEQPVSRADFNRFVQRALTTYPGIQALEWAPVVLAQERPGFEAALRATGLENFAITEASSRGGLRPADQRPYYIPVTYLQPLEGNERALGYDLASDQIRRTALNTARDTGRVSASGRIRLVQENKNQFGFLVFLPLYQTDTIPITVAERRRRLQGYLLGVFRVSDVVEESLAALDYTADFVLRDRNQFLGRYEANRRALTTRSGPLRPCPADCTHTLTTADQEWTITYAGAAYPIPWSALSTLAIGLLLTLLLSRYLAQAQAELERTREVSQVKIRLFSMASHELRTPLSTILLSAQALETGHLAPAQQRTSGRIRAAAKRMNQLLNDLLTLSRAESGKLCFAPEILDLAPYCQQLIAEVRFSFEQPPEITFSQTGPCNRAYVDPQLLRSMLTNLLSNAVKYSGDRPRVALRLVCTPHSFSFEIQDWGIGIPECDRTRLYDAFHRGTNVGSVTGTGLGLSVVNACLQLHQGRLTYESQLHQGSTFRLTLPRID